MITPTPFNKFDWEFVKGGWDVTITRISYMQHIIVQWQTPSNGPRLTPSTRRGSVILFQQPSTLSLNLPLSNSNDGTFQEQQYAPQTISRKVTYHSVFLDHNTYRLAQSTLSYSGGLWQSYQDTTEFCVSSQTQRDHVHAVGRTQLSLHRSSNLRNNTSSKSQLWQCSTSLFSLTSFYELSNEAFLTSTSIILGIPVPHALYLQATQRQYSNTDVWADSLLNKSNHAADSRKSTHAKLAQELTKIAIECGIPTTCNESRLPYRDEGQDQQSRKRADMITLTGCGINPNSELEFTSNTRVTIIIMKMVIM